MSPAEVTELFIANDLVVFSGYNYQGFGKLISKRDRSGRPWAFWGERPGFLIPPWIGRLYRKLAYPEIHRSNAPIWGIGSWAVDGYRNELGSNRVYLNVPYFSDLRPYFSIQRGQKRPDLCRFMFSGSFVRRKGIDLLVAAFIELVGRGSDAELHLLGDGPLKAALRTRTCAIADRVHFHGFRQWNELPAFYANANVLCAPSLYDGWGMIVPEGLASGMPVISTDRTGAARELITQDCGWVIPAGDKDALLDAMIRAATLPTAERNRMSECARLVATGPRSRCWS